MSTRLDENLGTVGFDNLIHGLYPPTEVFSVLLAAGQGILERGSVLATGDNGMTLLGGSSTGSTESDGEDTETAEASESSESTGTANAVLAETVDTGEGDAVEAIAYRTGHFNANALIVAEGYEITADDKEALRTAGILISDAVEI